MRAPGETYDHLCVWVPKYKAAFVGDNYYDSFPNIYTLRGTQPRWALDYVASIDKILALAPEIVLPSHGQPIVGRDKIVERLTRYRNAIVYVHDATVKGMNDGKDVFTLMREIKLPSELNVGEAYGKVDWSIRGIYEGYVGWFDLNPASMYSQPPTVAEPELVRMAGGLPWWPPEPEPWPRATRSRPCDWRMRHSWLSRNRRPRSRRSSPRSNRCRARLET